MKWSQGRNWRQELKQRPWRSAASWLQGLLSYLSNTPQDHLSGDGSVHSRLSAPISTTDLENAPLTLAYRLVWWRPFLNWDSFSQRILAYVKLIKTMSVSYQWRNTSLPPVLICNRHVLCACKYSILKLLALLSVSQVGQEGPSLTEQSTAP